MRNRDLGYGLVLVLAIGSVALQMSLPDSDASRFVTTVLQATTLVVAVRVSGVRPRGGRIAGLVAVVAVVASVLIWAARGDFPPAPAAVVNGLLVAFAPVAIVRGLVNDLRERGEVTAATLAGVLAIYLLAGMFFSFLYGVVGAVNADDLFAQVSHPGRQDELYFSFVTLTTVGYGDLSPAGGVTRTFAVTEMLAGQIYLVTVVSLIVSNLGALRR
jgi:hypothetical protein